MPALQGMKTTTHKNVRLKGAGIPSGLHMVFGFVSGGGAPLTTG
jgi:hypothetical protein